MSAVFLSYASEDAAAAMRIRDALQAAGVEVWFDQSELRGGDAWDAAIRKRIKECALFVPVISANSDARDEGYFRLEWKWAVDRSHLMADDRTFILPVAIDGAAEGSSRVPDRFREVQWSRLADAESLAAFAARARRLLDDKPREGVSRSPPANVETGDALERARHAASLQPRNAFAHRELGILLARAGHVREAVAALRTALQLDAKAGFTHYYLSIVRLLEGDALEARGWAQKEVLTAPRLLAIAMAEHTLGHAAESDAALARSIEDHGGDCAYQIAAAIAWRGEKDRAFKWIERAWAQRDPALPSLPVDPLFKSLHADARWPAFARKAAFVD
jgi:tetratricopeptide (TPR) repeat protein